MLKKLICFLSFLILYQAPQAYTSDLDSMKQVVETMPEDSAKCVTLINIALLLYSGEEPEVYAHRALELAKKLGIKELIGRSYYAVAWSHGYDEMDKKKTYLDSTVAVFTEIQNMDGLGLAYNINAIMHLEYGKPKEALVSLEKAYEYFGMTGKTARQATILNNIGVCLNDLGRHDEALVKYKEALAFRLKEEPQKPLNIGRVYYGLGETAKALEVYDQATDYYLQSLFYRKKAKNQAVAEALKGIALMIFEVAEKGLDTLSIVQKTQAIGYSTSFAMLDSAEAVPGVTDRIEFLAGIMDVRRKGHLLYGNYKQAYQLLEEQKKIEEDHKLSESSLGAFKDAV